jgi:hypothetical protein
MIKAFHGTKREALILACKQAPVNAQKLRFRQDLGTGWLIEFGVGPEKLGWHSIYALSVALGLMQKKESAPKDLSLSQKVLRAFYENNPGQARHKVVKDLVIFD